MKPLSILFLAFTFLFILGNKSQAIERNEVDSPIKNELSLLETTQHVINCYGDSIWKDLSKTPLRVLLITDSLEYLVNHPNPSNDFKLYKYDSVQKSNIYVRGRVFPKNLLAAFPAVNGVDCIVIGTPINTDEKNEDWVVSLLHEHFHLYQSANLQYQNIVKELSRKYAKRGDQWMLDYDFPYSDTTVAMLVKQYCHSLYEAFLSRGKVDFQEKVDQFFVKQAEIQRYLKPNDYNYFQYQIWSEGFATFTELKYLDVLNEHQQYYKESYGLDFNLGNEKLLKSYSSAFFNDDLRNSKRNIFYSIGLIKGVVYDKYKPNWRDGYFTFLNIE